jgi:hypothetical protein
VEREQQTVGADKAGTMNQDKEEKLPLLPLIPTLETEGPFIWFAKTVIVMKSTWIILLETLCALAVVLSWTVGVSWDMVGTSLRCLALRVTRLLYTLGRSLGAYMAQVSNKKQPL